MILLISDNLYELMILVNFEVFFHRQCMKTMRLVHCVMFKRKDVEMLFLCGKENL
jgi:hypothetical protein